MNVSIGQRWEGFVADAVKSRRYASASEAIRDGFTPYGGVGSQISCAAVELDTAIIEGGQQTDTEIDAALDAEAARPGHVKV